MRIDRRRKLPATTLLYALGLDQEGILDYFYTKVPFRAIKDGKWTTPVPASVDQSWMRNAKPNHDWTNPKTGEVLTEIGQKITVRALRKWQDDGIKNVAMPDEELVGRYSALDMVNVETGEIYVEAGDELTLDNISVLRDAGFDEIVTINVDHINIGAYIRNTMAVDKNHSREQALVDIYQQAVDHRLALTETLVPAWRQS